MAEDGSNSCAAKLLARRAQVVCPGVPLGTHATAVRAEGARIIDADGRSIIDLAGGIGVMTVGHCPSTVVQAISEQAGALLHTCIHIATYEPYVALCERLVGLFPHGKGTKALLVNSGAEAVENAVKIARQATGRSAILCYSGGFHGRTLLGMSLTSKVGYKVGCGPFAPEIYRLPFPSYYHYGDGLALDAFVARELQRLRGAFSTVVAASDVAAVILEVVQGEGGFIPVPPSYLSGLREICDEQGILLILDEVQSGFARTGHWAAYQSYGVTPDLSTWAKAMGGGLPIAAVLGRAEVMDAVRPGTVGGTYGGNPVACAAALSTIDLIERQGLCARAEAIGVRIRAAFNELAQRTPLVGDVRGLGAMMAMELVLESDPHRPATQQTAEILSACLRRGVLLISAGVHGNVIRVLCPLVIEDRDLEDALRVIQEEVLRRAR